VGHLIVDPSEVGVIADKGDDRLTLTACHPKYSAEQRIIVTATLLAEPNPLPIPEPAAPRDSEPPPAAPTDSEPRLAAPIAQARSMPNEVNAHDQDGRSGVEYAADDAAIVAASLGWQPQFAPATTLWAGATAIIAMAAWLAGRLWRRFPAYAMAVPPTMLTLYNCFDNLEKFIPAV
jgi:sortase A